MNNFFLFEKKFLRMSWGSGEHEEKFLEVERGREMSKTQTRK